MFPNFSYNEERPQYVGRDVEGIKELNTVLAQKYQLNKQAKIQAEDLLHSLQTLDVDSPYKRKAVEDFNGQLQQVVDNNEYENATQVVEKAVTGVKRNQGLQQSVKNYAAYQEYAQALKDDPKGWTDQEIASILAESVESYNGVEVNEYGEAVGTFNGYNPGKKVNMSTKADEALEGFAANKNVTVSALRDLLGNGTKYAMTTKENETITRDEVLAYIKNYYGNDPEIQKYYETKSIIDSRKSPVQLSRDLQGNLDELNIYGVYGSAYKDYLRDKGIDDQNKQIDAIDFVEYLVQDVIGDVDLNSVLDSAVEGDRQSMAILASVNTELDKLADMEAAAIKHGYSKESAKHNIISDELTLYKLKKLEDDSDYIFTATNAAVSFNDKYGSNRNGFDLLTEDLHEKDASLEAGREQISSILNKAAIDGAYDSARGVWKDTENTHYTNYLKAQQEQNIRQQERNNLAVARDKANEYAKEKVSGSGFKELRDEVESNRQGALTTYRKLLSDEINNNKDGRGSKIRTAHYREMVIALENNNVDKFEKLYNEANQLFNLDSILRGELLSKEHIVGTKTTRADNNYITNAKKLNRNKNEYKREYLEAHEVSTLSPRSAIIDEDAPDALVRAGKVAEDHYRLNNAFYVVRDKNGNILNKDRNRPDEIRINSFTTGRFADGLFYYQAEGISYDKKGNVVPGDTYYISASEPSFNEQMAKQLYKSSNLEAQVAGYSLLSTPNFRFRTEDIKVVDAPVPVVSISGNNIGKVTIDTGNYTGGDPNIQNSVLSLEPTDKAKAAYKDIYGVEPKTIFASRTALETVMGEIDAALNQKANE